MTKRDIKKIIEHYKGKINYYAGYNVSATNRILLEYNTTFNCLLQSKIIDEETYHKVTMALTAYYYGREDIGELYEIK